MHFLSRNRPLCLRGHTFVPGLHVVMMPDTVAFQEGPCLHNQIHLGMRLSQQQEKGTIDTSYHLTRVSHSHLYCPFSNSKLFTLPASSDSQCQMLWGWCRLLLIIIILISFSLTWGLLLSFWVRAWVDYWNQKSYAGDYKESIGLGNGWWWVWLRTSCGLPFL